MKTSVCTLLLSTPGACQNSELVVGSASMTTSHFRLASAWRTWLVSGPMLAAVIPERITPCILPLRAWSKIVIHDALDAGFGMKSKANSLATVAALPYQALRVLVRNFL